jgi:Family of unknown function (DUF6331)
MKLDPPLSSLVNRCQAICVAECCGIDAYDFSPIHIASYLLMHRGAPDPTEVSQIRTQLDLLKQKHGIHGTSTRGATFTDMNQGFTPAQIDSFVDEISHNLDVALRLIEDSEPKRYKRTE